MAEVSTTRQLPAQFIEALGKTYSDQLTKQVGQPATTTAGTQQPGESAAQWAQRQKQAQQYGITKAGMADLAPTSCRSRYITNTSGYISWTRHWFLSTLCNSG